MKLENYISLFGDKDSLSSDTLRLIEELYYSVRRDKLKSRGSSFYSESTIIKSITKTINIIELEELRDLRNFKESIKGKFLCHEGKCENCFKLKN